MKTVILVLTWAGSISSRATLHRSSEGYLGKVITLVVTYDAERAKATRDAIIKHKSAAPNGMNTPIPPGQTLEEFANNPDHCFIEHDPYKD